MTLYHGSHTAVEKPDLSFSRLRTDFGKGFYLTPLKTQAERWAERFLRERGMGVVSEYAFTPIPDKEVNILSFSDYSVEWLDFIMSCRRGVPVDAEWDLVIGGIANDKVFDTLQLYFDDLIRAEEAIRRLQYRTPNIQHCFKTQSVIDSCLRFAGSEVLK